MNTRLGLRRVEHVFCLVVFQLHCVDSLHLNRAELGAAPRDAVNEGEVIRAIGKNQYQEGCEHEAEEMLHGRFHDRPLGAGLRRAPL